LTRTARRGATKRRRLLRLEQLEQRDNPSLAPVAFTIQAAEGQAFTGTVAAFTTNDPQPLNLANYAITNVDWGDGTSSPADGHSVSIVADPNNTARLDVQGSHTFADEGTFRVQVTVTDQVDNTSATTAFFTETNLVTDNQSILAGLGFTPAAHVDPNLVNPWGISFAPTSPFWVSDNGTGVSTLYDGAGNAQALVVTIPASANPGATSPAPVTGQVFNSSSTDFNVAGPNTPAHFIFATEDGTIAGWNSGTSAVLKVDNADFTNGPVYKGLALGNNGSGNFLYAANFRSGTVDVFDTTFTKVNLAGNFTDPTLPAGFAPFGIRNINDQLFVTYALQNAARHDDVAGPGNGFVDVFDLNGNFVKRFASQGTLNSPWGLALAPATFGAFANDLLVGNFGDGHINAFNPSTGAFLGQLTNSHNVPIAIDGLWAITFGNNGANSSVGTLYFTAGINGEQDGLFGTLSAQQLSQATVNDEVLITGAVPNVTSTAFSGVGGDNTSTTSGTANAGLTSFEAAIGGANNGGSPPPQPNGFRTINWDGVKLDGTDPFPDTIIDSGHVVGIPINRFQERGVQFEQVYAVSGPASQSDASTFTTVNPTVGGLFPAFSPSNTFAMFNENTIDLSFVLASAHTTTPTPGATRGFGAIFENVRLANTTSIEYFHGDQSLGKFFVPVGTAGQAEFLGELFNSPIVTRVTLTLGTDVLFSFDGVHFHSGNQPDDPANGHNLVVTDDFVYAEPVDLRASQPVVSVNEGAPFSGPVATFTDMNPGATPADFTTTINFGNGQSVPGTVTSLGSGVFSVSGANTFSIPGNPAIHVLIQDVGGSQLNMNNTAQVKPVLFAVGADASGGPNVRVYDALNNSTRFDFMAFNDSFRGGVRVALGDVNGDGIPDIVVGAGPGGGPHVKVYDGQTMALLGSFFAYDPSFRGGVYVAVGDVNGDGHADIITGAGPGGGPHVKVIDGTKLTQVQPGGPIADSALLGSFFAYSPAFTGGVRVGAGDVTGDGKADVITGAGPAGGPHVKVFDGADLTHVIFSFFAFDSSYKGGVFVSAGDINGDHKADLAVSQGQGANAHVREFNGSDASQMADFVPFTGSGSPDGVRVALLDRDSDGLADIVAGAGPGTPANVLTFKGTTLAPEIVFMAFDPAFLGGVFVG
jgi:uncharacterized protein (TIGR03118 family)